MSKQFKIYLLSALLAAAPSIWAADEYASPAPMKSVGYQAKNELKPVSYGEAISEKLEVGLANVALSALEVPKNMINISNEYNIALGITGGVLKGLMQTTVRMMAGVVDTMTFPIATQPLPTPKYPWENYTVETNWDVPLFKARPLK